MTALGSPLLDNGLLFRRPLAGGLCRVVVLRTLLRALLAELPAFFAVTVGVSHESIVLLRIVGNENFRYRTSSSAVRIDSPVCLDTADIKPGIEIIKKRVVLVRHAGIAITQHQHRLSAVHECKEVSQLSLIAIAETCSF